MYERGIKGYNADNEAEIAVAAVGRGGNGATWIGIGVGIGAGGKIANPRLKYYFKSIKL